MARIKKDLSGKAPVQRIVRPPRRLLSGMVKAHEAYLKEMAISGDKKKALLESSKAYNTYVKRHNGLVAARSVKRNNN